jgi:histone deacetylase 1/2
MDPLFADFFREETLPKIWQQLNSRFKKPDRFEYYNEFTNRNHVSGELVERYVRMKWALGRNAELQVSKIFTGIIEKLNDVFRPQIAQLLTKYEDADENKIDGLIQELNRHERFMADHSKPIPMLHNVNVTQKYANCQNCAKVAPKRCPTHFAEFKMSWKCKLCNAQGRHTTNSCNLKCPRCFKESGQAVSFHKCPCSVRLQEIKNTASSAYSPVCPDPFYVLSALTSDNTNRENWIVDSGASCHFACDSELFESLDYTQKREFKYADGCTRTSEGIGKVNLMINGKTITLYDVLFVPFFNHNLMSVASLNFSVAFGPNGCARLPDGFVFAELDNSVKLYMIRPNTQSPPTNISDILAANITASGSNPSTFVASDIPSCNATVLQDQLIHRRFGHYSAKVINDTMKLITGSNTVTVKSCDCHTCAAAKLHENPYRSTGHTVPSSFHTLHCDLLDFRTNQSLNGYKFALVITDEYTRYSFAYPLSSKSEKEIVTHFSNLFHFIDTQTDGNRVKVLRADHGTEFTNRSLRALLDSRGISLQLSSPGHPSQNGLAERHNQTIKNIMLAGLVESKLPNALWPEALQYAVFLKNRVVSTATGKIPLNAAFQKMPSIADFRVFGCIAYGHVPAAQQTPLCDKGEKGIFLGRDEISLSYLLYNIQKRKIVKYRTVKWFENEFPATFPLPGNITLQNLPLEIMSPVIPAEPALEASPNPTIGLGINLEQLPSVFEDPTPLCDVLDTVSPDTTEVSHENPQNSPAESENNFLPEDGPSSPQRRVFSRKNRGVKFLDPDVVYYDSRSLLTHNTDIHPNSDTESQEIPLVNNTMLAPKTYRQAITESSDWEDAMQNEYNNFTAHNAFSLVRADEANNILPARWLFSLKHDDRGKVCQHKARFIVQGYMQDDSFSIYSPTLPATTLRLMLSCAASNDYEIQQMDVSSAYLHADMPDEVYIHPPQGFTEYTSDNTKLVWKLHKAVYGLKNAPSLWNQHLKSVLSEFNLVASPVDPCLFFLKTSDIFLAVLFHVDDLLLICSSVSYLTDFKARLKTKLKVKDLGDLHHFLGIVFKRDRKKRLLYMNQNVYVNTILDRFNCNDIKPASIPLPNEPIPPFDAEAGIYNCPYMELVGSLNYIVNFTRPELAYATSALSQFMKNHNEVHWKLAKHVLRYLQKTRESNLTLGGYLDPTKHVLTAYCDADHAKNLTDSRSRSGNLILYNNRPIHWLSKKQTTPALSTTEAEYISLSENCRAISFCLTLLGHCGYSNPDPVPTMEDNQAALKLASDATDLRRVRHLQVRFHLIREYVATKIISLHYCNSENMIADMLTKPLGKAALHRLMTLMLQDT